MSRATRQTVLLLSTIAGIFITMGENAPDAEFMPTVEYGRTVAVNAARAIPETGDREKNDRWMLKAVTEMEKFLNCRTEKYSFQYLVFLAACIIDDLMQKTKNKQKLEILEPVQEAVFGLQEQVDPSGTLVEVYKNVDDDLSNIYTLLDNL